MSIRPTGITISALLLGFLALSGVGNAALRLPSVDSHQKVTGALASLYALAAGAACVGLWRMRSVGLQAFRAWTIACLLLAVWSPIGLGLPLPGRVVLNLGLAALLFLWHRYLLGQLPAALPGARGSVGGRPRLSFGPRRPPRDTLL